MNTYLIVGTGFNSLNKAILENSDTFVILKDAAFAKPSLHHQKMEIETDFSSKEKVLETVGRINKKTPINGVITIYENYVRACSYIAEHLGLPGMSLTSAEACTDKLLMRSLFSKAPETISPDFAEVKSEQDIINFAKSHDFPLVLKPANLAKSLLVTKSKDLDELIKNYKLTSSKLTDTYKRYAKNHQPKLLVEEFLDGSVHSVDAFIDQEGKVSVLEQVVDYQTGYDIGHEDNFHYSRTIPTKLPASAIKTIRETAELGCKTLGMKSSPAHIEVILTPNGPRIVEIGARVGGYRARMHKLANGIDMTANHLRVVTGREPLIKPTRNDNCVVLELFPASVGVFKEIQNELKLHKLPSLAYFSIKVSPGDVVGKAAEGYKMCAVIMLHNSDSVQFDKDLSFINNYIKVITLG